MLKTTTNSRFLIFIAITILVLAQLACGTNATPRVIATAASTSEKATDVQPTEKVEKIKPSETSAPTSEKATENEQDASSLVEATDVQPTEKVEKIKPSETPKPVELVKYKIGDIVGIGNSVMIVLGWEEIKGDQFNKPDEGKKFIAVELIIVNNSDDTGNISTLLQMEVKDDTGQKYHVDLMALMAIRGGSLDGELAPGEKIRGKVGFSVDENATGLEFVFDADIFGTGKVFVDLGSEPIFVEPPADIAGETEQQTYKVGDVIEIGTMLLTVNEVTSPKGDQFNKPSEGNKFVVIDLTIENKSDEAINISSLLQMSLKTSEGTKYSVDLMASTASGGSTPDGEVAPGEKIRGQVGFQIPETSTGLIFVFDADVFGAGKVYIALP